MTLTGHLTKSLKKLIPKYKRLNMLWYCLVSKRAEQFFQMFSDVIICNCVYAFVLLNRCFLSPSIKIRVDFILFDSAVSEKFYFKHNVGSLFIFLIRNPDVVNIGDAFLINSILRQRRF